MEGYNELYSLQCIVVIPKIYYNLPDFDMVKQFFYNELSSKHPKYLIKGDIQYRISADLENEYEITVWGAASMIKGKNENES